VEIDFSRPGKATDNAHIEAFAVPYLPNLIRCRGQPT
jgi:hypothetical protein